jgi:uncharacterized protein (TIGR00661 family)
MYGVQADGAGHINHARIVAQVMPHHEFLFVGGGGVRGLDDGGCSVEPVPFLDTLYRNNRIDVLRTAAHGLRVLSERGSVVDRLAGIMRDFDPDLVVTDYEYFTPIAARKLDRFCVSMDHQHILTRCVYDRPNRAFLGRLMGNAVMKGLFSKAGHFLIISFFRLPPADPVSTEVFPPLIKRAVTEQKPSEGDHVLVYQTSETFEKLLPVLETMDRRFQIYGFGKRPSRGNLLFKERSEESFAEDLASCLYVIANGGHTVLSEALYLGKPVFVFPIGNHYEQITNASFVEKLGYGSYSMGKSASSALLEGFQSRLDEYRAVVKSGDFFGNARLVRRLEELIERG